MFCSSGESVHLSYLRRQFVFTGAVAIAAALVDAKELTDLEVQGSRLGTEGELFVWIGGVVFVEEDDFYVGALHKDEKRVVGGGLRTSVVLGLVMDCTSSAL